MAGQSDAGAGVHVVKRLRVAARMSSTLAAIRDYR
jgi:hypothetical protein